MEASFPRTVCDRAHGDSWCAAGARAPMADGNSITGGSSTVGLGDGVVIRQ